MYNTIINFVKEPYSVMFHATVVKVTVNTGYCMPWPLASLWPLAIIVLFSSAHKLIMAMEIHSVKFKCFTSTQ